MIEKKFILNDLRDEVLTRALQSFGIFQITNDEVGDCIGERYRRKLKKDIFKLVKKQWKLCKREARNYRPPKPKDPAVTETIPPPITAICPQFEIEIIDKPKEITA